MEQERHIEKSENKRLSVTGTSLTLLGPVSPPESYNVAMLVLVSDSFTASASTPTLAEKMDRAEVWSRLLHQIIPEGRLQDAFDLAFCNHTSNFPVSAYDMKLAWAEIQKTRPAVDFSWCANGCDPETGLLAVMIDGKRCGWMQCIHVRQEAA